MNTRAIKAIHRPRRQKLGDRLVTPGARQEEIASDHAVAPFDRLALDMDRTWGIDRLPELVGPETAAKYGSAIAKLNAALATNEPKEVAARAGVCMRGLQAMDTEARQRGHSPQTPLVGEYEHEGRKFGIVREVGDWPVVSSERPCLTLYTLQEVAVALHAHKNAALVVEEIKQHFPGAQIRSMTETSQEIVDAIPF